MSEDQQTISEHFGDAPYFRLISLDNTGDKIIEEHLLENPYLNEEKGKGIKVANWLLENGIDVMISHQDQSGKGPGLVLGNAGAEILLTKETNAEKALAEIQSEHREKAIP